MGDACYATWSRIPHQDKPYKDSPRRTRRRIGCRRIRAMTIDSDPLRTAGLDFGLPPEEVLFLPQRDERFRGGRYRLP